MVLAHPILLLVRGASLLPPLASSLCAASGTLSDCPRLDRKFVVINLLIIFTVGTTAFTAILNAFSSPASILDVVAGAFPRAATFYISYLLLQIGVQTGVELSLLGISWINHASIRKYVAPRKRALENIPRFFGAQTW